MFSNCLILTPFSSNVGVLKGYGVSNVYTIDLFLYNNNNKNKNVCLIIDDVNHVSVLKFWKVLKLINPVKIILLADVYDRNSTYPYETNRQILPNLLHDVLLKQINHVIYFENTYRFSNTNGFLYKNIMSKDFKNMDDSFHIISCNGSLSELEKQIKTITPNETKVLFICQNVDFCKRANDMIISKGNEIPIVCKQNYYKNNKLIVWNGDLGVKRNKQTLIFHDIICEDIKYEVAHVLPLTNVRGRECDNVIFIQIEKKVPLDVLYYAASRAKNKFLLLTLYNDINYIS